MKKFYHLFSLLSRGKQIAAVVSFVHLMALFALTIHHLATSRLKAPRPMVVKTFSLQQASPTQVGASKSVTAAAVQKPSSPKPAAQQKTIAAKPKITNDKLLKSVAESLETIKSEPKNKARPSLNVPSKRGAKVPVVEEKEVEVDGTYAEFLIAFLQQNLELPEYGEVKMEIEIDGFGKLVQCQILKAKSVKNATFLKEELAHLSFPIPHLDRFENSKKLTITFRH